MEPWIPNAIGLLGVAALAVPAIATDKLAGRMVRIANAARNKDTDEFLRKLRDDVRAEMPPNAWRPLYRIFLYGGYTAILLSAILRMIPQTTTG